MRTACGTTVSAVSTRTPSRVDDTSGRPRWNGRYGWVFGAVWLVYLAYPWSAAWSAAPGPARDVSLTCVVLFGAVFVSSLRWGRRSRRAGAARVPAPQRWAILGVQAVLVAGMALAAHESALAGLVFMGTAAVFLNPPRTALVVVALLAAASEVVPRVVPGWSPEGGIGIQVVLASVAIFGFTQLLARNAQLDRARTELADLAVARERERMARDVHDILGHSLTVITVKAELAGRLLAVSQERAASEIADIESLARAALADVRATVTGFRQVGLAHELASARAALQAAGIEAVLPNAADDVPERLRELFAWAIREGTTNVIRHSGGRTCEVTLSPTRVRIRDDGQGPSANDVEAPGTGLVGLRERAEAAGARVTAGRVPGGGFELCVETREVG